MKINVHVKEKTILIDCSEGNQRIMWLAHVALARYDQNFGLSLGVPRGVQCATGDLMDIDAQISETLQDEQHVWVLLKDDQPTPKIPYELIQRNLVD